MPKNPGILAEFDLFPVQNEARTAEEGRPIFEDKVYVRLLVPGDKFSEVHRQMRESDKTEYPEAWAAFQSGQPGAVIGTPLAHWPAITAGQVKELAHFNVRSVEQLAELSDANAQNVGPVIALRQRARDYLAAAKGDAPLAKMRADVEKLEHDNATLKQQLQEQAQALDKLRRNKG